MSTGRRKLLVADDSLTVQKVISLTFEDEGVEVLVAGDGVEALRIMRAGPPPDVLLADVVMPGPNGYELCERVKRDPRLRHMPVVLLVGKFEPFNEAEARRVGADTVLTKPFQSIRDLVSKVGSLIGGESKEAGRDEEREDRGDHPAAHADAARSEPEPERRPVPPAREARTPDAPQAASAQPPADEPRFSPDAGAGAAAHAPDVFHRDPASSFADLGVDDEMIEARPAEAFGTRAHSARPESVSDELSPSRAAATADDAAEASFGEQEPSVLHSTGFEPGELFDAADFEPEPPRAAPAAHASAPEAEAPRAGASQREPQNAFAARAAAAATADDALLDLGGFGSSEQAAGRATEADDFILDLDEDEPPYASASTPAHAAAPAPAAHDLDLGFEPEAAPDFTSEPARDFAPDAASDFARGAGTASSFASFDEPAPAAVDDAAAFAEAAHGEPAARADEFDFDLLPQSEAASRDVDVAREVVAEDVPPQFEGFDLRDDPLDFGFVAAQVAEPEPFAAEDAQPETVSARHFIEPTVVPAEEPPAGSFGGEFTDGSVEGDLPRPPAAFAPATGSESVGVAGAGAAPVSEKGGEASEPSSSYAAGYTVGGARAGMDERPRAGNLSPEDVEAIARRIVELMSDRVVREIAWEVVPELAELHVRRRLEEERGR